MADLDPRASAMSFAVIGVANLETTLGFFRDAVGLDASPTTEWKGPAFEAFWHLPTGARSRCALLSFAGRDVGRVLLVEFQDAGPRRRIRPRPYESAIGYANVNLYTADVTTAAARLKAAGGLLWSEPVYRDFGATGRSGVVILEGPDAFILCALELSGPPGSVMGDLRAFTDAQGWTRHGFTPLVTLQQWVRSIDEATPFYRDVLGMTVVLEAVRDDELSLGLMRLPAGSRIAMRMFKGRDLFGKVEPMAPLNWTMPSLEEAAVAPNIGMLAHAFDVPDLDRALGAAPRAGAASYTSAMAIDFPAIGRRQAAMVRAPGSGALAVLYQRPA